MVVDLKRVACPCGVGVEPSPRVEMFKYLGGKFTSEGNMISVNDQRIGVASAMMYLLYRSVVGKKKLS